MAGVMQVPMLDKEMNDISEAVKVQEIASRSQGVQSDIARPWWREPWPWLLMSGPMLAMIGCGVTIWLAHGHPDRPIADGVVRHGLVVESVAGKAMPPAAPVPRRQAR